MSECTAVIIILAVASITLLGLAVYLLNLLADSNLENAKLSLTIRRWERVAANKAQQEHA
jgi:hypothetical protein